MKYIIIIAALLTAPSAFAEWGNQVWGLHPWGYILPPIPVNSFIMLVIATLSLLVAGMLKLRKKKSSQH